MSKLLNKVVHGYTHLEPVLFSALALRAPIFLIGSHGVGKSALAKLLAKAITPEGNGYRFYSADKSNLVILGGLPKTENGVMSFTPTKLSIWGASVVLADELPRASKENQNYWLEIVENETFYGIPINEQDEIFLIATGNTDTYKGNFKFDLALKSRFYAWIPVPTFDSVESGDVVQMIRANRQHAVDDKLINKVAKDIRVLLDKINTKYQEYMANDALLEQVDGFTGTFFQILKADICRDGDLNKDENALIPPREFAKQFPELLLAMAAYYSVEGHSQPFIEAANQTIRYNVITRHAAVGAKLESIATTIFRSIKGLLSADVSSPAGRLTVAYASAISPEQKVGFWQNKMGDALNAWDDEMLIATLGETLQMIKERNMGLIGSFWAITKNQPRAHQVANEISGFLITELARRISRRAPGTDNTFERLWNEHSQKTGLTAADIGKILNA